MQYQITIASTSAPNILKFESNHFLTQHTNHEYGNIDEAKNSPLAQQLFYLPFVKKVYIAPNFVAIDKYEIAAWEDVQEAVASKIEDYLNSGEPVLTETNSNMPITVYSESTPNPAVLKFVCNKKLANSPITFTSAANVEQASIIKKLLDFPFVKEIFIDQNYIAIHKIEAITWETITLELREFIRDQLRQTTDLLLKTANENTKENTGSSTITPQPKVLDETSKEIVQLLETHIKPAVASDGGNIAFESYNPKTKTVKVLLQGACSGCPSSTATLKHGIENLLRQMLTDKVEAVEAVNT